jgi:hypothetical protein
MLGLGRTSLGEEKLDLESAVELVSQQQGLNCATTLMDLIATMLGMQFKDYKQTFTIRKLAKTIASKIGGANSRSYPSLLTIGAKGINLADCDENRKECRNKNKSSL